MISGNSIAFKAVTPGNPIEMDQSMRSGRRLEMSALEDPLFVGLDEMLQRA
jgi:hypothetical protein